MKKYSVFYLVVGIQLILTVSFLSGQSNELIDQLLEQEEASYGHSVYMVLTAIGELPEEASPERATEVLREKGWDLSARDADEAVSLGEYSHLIMRALNIPGGIMYGLFPGPRYAARELKYLNFISGRSSPGRSLSGTDALYILGRVLEGKEARS